MPRIGAIWFVALSILSAGCAAFGVVATSDPIQKLSDADYLYSQEQRPLPAERMIREAISLFEQRNDWHWTGHAYRTYGDLLTSNAIVKWETVYRRDGFLDPSITYANRFSKASDFYRQALTYYLRAEGPLKEAGKFDALTNLYFNMALSSYKSDQLPQACSYYDQSLSAYAENLRRNPDAKPQVPRGFSSYSEVVDLQKKRAACA